MLRPGVSNLNNGGCGGGLGVPCGDMILIRQSSASPVALECAIEDDSNGSIARDRFNLGVYYQHKDKTREN